MLITWIGRDVQRPSFTLEREAVSASRLGYWQASMHAIEVGKRALRLELEHHDVGQAM